jgi:tetratricopeptide (TPR) repeat protein
MLRNRLILLGAIVLAVIGLYRLPRVVVDNRESEVSAQNQSDSDDGGAVEDFSTMSSAHQTPIPDSSLAVIENLRLGLENAKNLEKRFIFADSLAEQFQSVGKYDSAGRYFELKAQIKPSLEAYEMAGEAYYNAFRIAMDESSRNRLAQKTREYFGLVLEEAPGKLELKVKTGMTYISGSNPMQGISMIREVLEQDPDNEEALYQMGILAMTSGQFEKGVERFSQLVRINPDNAEARFYLGYSYLELGDKEKAKESFLKVIEMDGSPEITEEAKHYLQNI